MRVTPVILFAYSLLTTSLACQDETSGTSPTAPAEVVIPAYCGYAHPDARALRRDTKNGYVLRADGELRYYVETTTPGKLGVEVLRIKGAPATEIQVSMGRHPDGDHGKVSLQIADLQETAHIGTFGLVEPGMHCIIVKTIDGSALGDLRALRLFGPAAAAAKTCTVERRNASSVHLGYPIDKAHRDDIEWFYCEVTPKTDPLWTYYMATGWHRGYFGMQVNSKTERRLIFSVWDSGNEAVDRKNVKKEDRVQLMGHGEGVHVSGFGNEGTGGHSHLVYPWKLGNTFRFLVHAQPDGKRTTYTGWFWFPDRGESGEWGLIASFKAPKDGKHLRGLYSFSENFSGNNGDRHRECEFGNVWVRTKGGEWLPCLQARFTHDGHGKQHRLDRRGGVRDGRFFLRHGDFATKPMRYGAPLELPKQSGKSPATLPGQ